MVKKVPSPGQPVTDPLLSIILVTDEGGRGIDRILARLADQSIAASLEVLVAAVDPGSVAIQPSYASAFNNLKVLLADTTTSATARAIAIQSAKTPYVALAEDHSFPVGDQWAENFLNGLKSGYAAVGPSVCNANPDTRISWANLLVEYGPWLSDKRDGNASFLPGHNSAYRRDLLLGYGEALAEMLEAEWVLQAELRKKGHKLLFDPKIKVAHLNYSFIGRSVRLQFLNGRMFAASRANGWAYWKRLFFALMSPAIPIKRTLRVSFDVRSNKERKWYLVSSLPMTVLLLIASGIGEGIGYLLGDGGQRNALAQMEYRRWCNLKPEEVHLAR